MATTPAPLPSIDIGRVITRGFDALFKNAVPFFGASLVLAGVPALLLEMYFVRTLLGASPEQLFMSGGFWLNILLSIIVTMVTTALLQGILVRSTILHLSGQRVDLGHSVTVALGMILPIIGLSIIVGICVMFGLLLLIVPGIIVYCVFAVAVPALVEERKGVFASMSRSSDLTSGSRLMIFLLGVIYFVIFWILSAVVSGMTGAAVYSSGAMLVSGIGQMLLTTFTSALSATLIASLYAELRTIKEGATPSSLAQVFS